MLKVVFRADASIKIGTGHVMRCLTLADELRRQGHECRFICRAHPGHLGDLVTTKGHGLTLLTAPAAKEPDPRDSSSDNYAQWLGAPWQEDASQTLDAVKTLKPDWLVVDHYALDAEWERVLANAAGNIMVIDDLANRPHECAVLVDQNFGREAADYDELLSAGCQRLIGPRYALLRPEFAQLREQSLKRRQHLELKRILVSLGGVDRTNVTGQVLEVLAKSSIPASTEMDIIMGSAAPHLNEVQQLAARLPFKATVSVDVKNMAERMMLADLAIGAAGSTSWERCCLGLPTLLMVLAENQVAVAKALAAAGAAITIGDTARVGTTLPSVLESFRDTGRLKQMIAATTAITDGNGVFSVVQAMSTAERRD